MNYLGDFFVFHCLLTIFAADCCMEITIRGQKSPLFYYPHMIAKEKVQEVIAPEVEKRGLLLVDLTVNNRNKITVVLDAARGVSIDDCAAFTGLIEGAFDREVEDFELEVASAGVGQPLKMKEQYSFNVGRTISLLDGAGAKHTGTLTGVEPDGILLEETLTERVKGKKKATGLQSVKYTWEQIKLAKVQVSFK
jgi:ribosome maturation factor RimP